VAGALAAIGPQAADAIPALSRMTGNIREDVGQAASEALVSISPNGKGLAPALMSAVYNRDGVSVKRLAAAMASSKDATAIMPALKTLATNDPDAGTRASAQRAIVWLAPAPTTQEVPKQGDK
jgi:HEAT repeat protein